MSQLSNRISKLLKPLAAEWAFIVCFVVMNNAVELPYLLRGRPLALMLSREAVSCCVSAFIAAVAVLFYTRRGMRWLKWVVTAVMAIGFFIGLFLYLQFNCPLQASLITLLLETDGKEAAGFLSDFALERATLLSAGMTLALIAVMIVADRTRRDSIKPFLMRVVMAVAVLIGAVFFPVYVFNLLPEDDADGLVNKESGLLSNADFLSRLTVEVMTLRQVNLEADAMERVTAAYDETPTVVGDSLNIVVVIGESYNKYHASLYGYALETTPRMTAELTAGRLIRFDDAVAPYNVTSQALKSMLSVGSVGEGERWYEYPFFTTIFRRAGYDVLMWDGQNTMLGNGFESDFDLTLNSVLYSDVMSKASYTACNDRRFRYDHQLVEDFFDHNMALLRRGRTLAVIHLEGQHIAYDRHYPDEPAYRVFTAADVTTTGSYMTDDKRRTVAEYDNATRYNDYVLGRIFDGLEGTRSIVVYLADHGEEVYDYRDFKMRDRSARKTPQMVKYENDIPMIIRFSPSLTDRKAALPADVASRPFIAYDLPHLLMGLGGVRSKYYRPERDLLSDRYRPSRRIIYDNIDYDRLMRR